MAESINLDAFRHNSADKQGLLFIGLNCVADCGGCHMWPNAYAAVVARVCIEWILYMLDSTFCVMPFHIYICGYPSILTFNKENGSRCIDANR